MLTTADCVDPRFNDPYVDIDEQRNTPVPHRYIHGGFKGTDARFSFYFPPREQYQGRFFQNTHQLLNSENGPPGNIGFAVSSGAYYVQTNIGGFERATTTEQADKDLARFYADVLPRDVSAARHQTYAHLAALADEHNLAVARRTYAIDDSYKGRLQRLQIAMVLTGEYADVRDFIYALETSPEFVVIEDVSVAEGARLESGLTVNLQLATYFRGDGAHGS